MKALLCASISFLLFHSASAAPLTIVSGQLGSGKLYAPCTFDGVVESCFVDTGAAFNAVADLPRFASYPVTGKISFMGASGILRDADEITIGALQFDSSTTVNAKVARLDSREGFESVIGIQTIGAQSFTFQFGVNPSFSFGVTLPAEAFPGVEIYQKGVFSIPVQIGTSQAKGLWDTGAGLTAIDIDYVNAHPTDFTFVMDIPDGSDATGNPVVMKLYRARQLTLGKHVFTDEYILAMGFDVVRERIARDVQLIIGFNLITKADWFFDLQKKRWWAE